MERSSVRNDTSGSGKAASLDIPRRDPDRAARWRSISGQRRCFRNAPLARSRVSALRNLHPSAAGPPAGSVSRRALHGSDSSRKFPGHPRARSTGSSPCILTVPNCKLHSFSLSPYNQHRAMCMIHHFVHRRSKKPSPERRMRLRPQNNKINLEILCFP